MLPSSAPRLMDKKRALLARIYVAALPENWDYHDKRRVLREITRIAQEGEGRLQFVQTELGLVLSQIREADLTDEEYNSILTAMQVHESLKGFLFKVLATHHLTPKYIKDIKNMALDACDLLTAEDIAGVDLNSAEILI